MDLNLAKIFVAVYQNGSYTKAAEELNITQPGVSLSIKRFEKELGAQLFVRDGRSIAPTARANQIIEPLESALNLFYGVYATERQVQIYAVEAILHLIGRVEGVKFTIPPTNQQQSLSDLRHNKVEMLIDNVHTQDPVFRVEPLPKQKIVVACSKNHPRLTGETITKKEFYQEDHVVLKTRRDGSQLIDILTPDDLHPRSEVMEAASLSGVALLASSTDCICCLSEPFALMWAEKLDLKIFELPFESTLIPFHLVYHRRFIDDPHHKKVRETIKNMLSNT